MNIAILIAALIAVESGGDPNAVGDNGEAIGVLQIHPILVQEINRVCGTSYTLEDRWSREKSIEMASAYFLHRREWSYERAARLWNGGPRGRFKEETLPYWKKVKRELKKRGVSL